MPEGAFRSKLCGSKLVFGDLGDGAHRALLDAVAARLARVLVHNVGNAADDLENALRARVDADAAPNALIGLDNRMGHE